MAIIREMLERGRQILQKAGRENARLDSSVLLGHVLGVERAMLYAYPERAISSEQEQRFSTLIERRKQGEPVAYLVGYKEFYGHEFLVDRRVLIPRPETELLVEAALAAIHRKLVSGQIPVVSDIGTGSGAIPIALALEEPRLPFLYATDISTAALEVARLNCQRHHVGSRVRLLQGDLLAPLPEPVDILIANLPYVGTDEIEHIQPDVSTYEPHLALFSGPRGLDALKRLCQEAAQTSLLKPGAVIFLEIGYQHREPLTQLIGQLWPQARVTCQKDYSGWDRLLRIDL